MITVRASDAERERVSHILETAVAEGRLTPDEGGERLATASAARFRDELAGLVADLPAPDPRPAPRRRMVGGAVAAVLFVALLLGVWMAVGVRLFWPFWLLAFIGFRAFGRIAWGPRRRWGHPRWTVPG